MESWYVMPHPPLAIPDVGRGEERKIAATLDACKAAGRDIARRGIETIIIISPHGIMFRDAVSIIGTNTLEGDMERFGAPQARMEFTVNKPLVEDIVSSAAKMPFSGRVPFYLLDSETAKRNGFDIVLDHGALVPLYYATASMPVMPSLVHITYGMLPFKKLLELGKLIRDAADRSKSRTACIASGDLSHRLTRGGPYSYSPRGAEFDAKVVDILKRGAFTEFADIDLKLSEEAGECGLRSLIMLAGMFAEGEPSKSEVLSYEGPFGVGYCVAEGTF
ncbi:hypothetical protein K7I13_04260 [Brucepastera parasyntrophica]|uniref:class III extradiol dioxygenase subunit B-like domain-containing protein n=1 Tax=Brucepastera parasyntrophica TaxID=2880008 RepID=UPI00210A2FFF|nr:class III extradiol dioxygenase subunit B-like domain-containing protein [Brucepastera parasyntrophica]ULQ60519.1 hypothetical protein K7I13_04260 [Brucepastera parasyntrophica]